MSQSNHLLTEDNLRLTRWIIEEADHGDRSLFDTCTPDEKEVTIRIARQLREKGRNETGGVLWELDYIEKPPTIMEFIDDEYYLGGALYGGDDGEEKTGGQVWPAWRDVLEEIFERKLFEIILTGAIGTGKTSIGQIIIAYDLCKFICLKDPQSFYGMMRGTPLTIGLFNIDKEKAYEINYVPIRRRLILSPFFQKYLDDRPRFERYIRVVGDKVRIALGSDAVHALGEAIGAGMLDEANFRAMGKPVDNAAKTYTAIAARMRSRFMEGGGRLPGHLVLLSSKSYAHSFLERHIDKVKAQIGVFVADNALYEMKPGHWMKTNWSGETFRVLVGDKYHDSRILEEDEGVDERYVRVENVPVEFKPDFERDCEKQVRDICGISTHVVGALFTNRQKLREFVTKGRKHPFNKIEVPCGLSDPTPIERYLNHNLLVALQGKKMVPKFSPKAKRYIHVDLAKTGATSWAGIAMGCRGEPKIVDRIDGDGKAFTITLPTVWFDFYLRINPIKGDQIDFTKIATFIIFLRKIGFRIAKVTFDQYQSTHGQQLLAKKKFEVGELSVDRNDKPYVALREAIYDNRVFGYDYPLLTDPQNGELANLVHDTDKRKVDHDAKGSKDVADCVAAVAYHILEEETVETEDTRRDETLKYIETLAGTHATMMTDEEPETEEEDISWIYGDYRPGQG